MTPDNLWAPTQSPQKMPDGPGESFEAYRAKLRDYEAERMGLRLNDNQEWEWIPSRVVPESEVVDA